MVQLSAAIKNGDSRTVHKLISMDTALNRLINANDNNGHMPLHNAARFDQVETACLLIELHAKLNAKNRYDDTPLHVACKFGQWRTADLLITFGADIEIRGQWQYTPLHAAAAEGKGNCIDLLLRKGANPLARTATDKDFANTPLHLAAWFGKTESIYALLNKRLWSQQRLMELRECKNNQHNTALHLAAFSGKVDAVDCLIVTGANFESRGKLGRQAIHMAAIQGHRDVVRLLLEKGAYAKSRSGQGSPDLAQTPIHLASYHGNSGVIEALLEHDPRLIDLPCNYQKQTPLIRAITNFQVTSVETLLCRGANPNLTDATGASPISMARFLTADIASFRQAHARQQIIKLLTEYGASELNSVSE